MKNTKSTTAETTAEATQTKETKKTTEKTANTAFDILLEAQTKLVDSIIGSTKKIADVLNANEAIDKSKTYLNEWLEKQQVNLESSTETIKTQVKFDNAPVFVKEVVEAQEEFGKEWYEALKITLKAKDAKELQEILAANVEKLQEKLKTIAGYWTENFGKPIQVKEVFTVDYAKEMTKKWIDMWKPALVVSK